MFVVSDRKLGIAGINRATNNSRSMDIGRPNLLQYEEIPTVVGHDVRTIFLT